MSNYPYIGQLSPAVGNGLGGIPLRRQSTNSLPQYIDPYYSSVTFLSGFETSTNANLVGKATATNFGAPTLSTAQRKFGVLSLNLPTTSDYVSIDASSFISFIGDFTVEGWFYNSSFIGKALFGGGTNTAGRFRVDETGNTLQCEVYSLAQLSVAPLPVANQWNHVALCRKSGVVKLYTNGICTSFTGTDSSATVMNNSNTFYIGRNCYNTDFSGGFIDDFRITNGVCRYDGNFTVPSISFI